MIYTPRRFYIFMRRTTISYFSFLISNSIEAFNRNQGAARPMGLPLLQQKTAAEAAVFCSGCQMK